MSFLQATQCPVLLFRGDNGWPADSPEEEQRRIQAFGEGLGRRDTNAAGSGPTLIYFYNHATRGPPRREARAGFAPPPPRRGKEGGMDGGVHKIQWNGLIHALRCAALAGWLLSLALTLTVQLIGYTN